MAELYNHKEIEQKWQKYWSENLTYTTTKESAQKSKKRYILDMFPYPSGAGLHVGHPRGYIASDVYSRFSRMNGFSVLHPMGWDAFGLPAENFAIKNKVHPSVSVEKNIEHFKEQLNVIGFDYDWSREINTTDPEYYKWTQWIFLQMFQNGLAYESHEPINWCPMCQTGLANEDLEPDGACERCGSKVEKKPMRQWVLDIRKYADRLVDDLELLTQWPEHVKEAQRNWIGRSNGAEISFKLQLSSRKSLEIGVFTTRPDTLFGATYMVIAPEHRLVHDLENDIENLDEVKAYIETAGEKSEIDRTDMTKDKTGVEIRGVTAINPANGEEIPVWIADYVLADYGTGAIMAVPAHDERDFAFAQKYDIKIQQVITGDDEVPFTGYGQLVNSNQFDGMPSEKAKEQITEFVNGKTKTTYKLRNWVFSRQRYWGEPIPLVHVGERVYPVDESQLPVVLPEVEGYAPTGTGESPLVNISDWVNVMGYLTTEGTFRVTKEAPKGSELVQAKRETNTMPQWAGSSWYWLRYIDPDNTERFIDPKKEKNWNPVDVYVGGDHATRHLIYARFWHKFLFDIGAVSHEEPFDRLEFLGYILAEDGRKMSKRWGNVIDPKDVVERFGADAFRSYEMFIGPFENTVPWSTDGLVGTRRFIEKVWRTFTKVIDHDNPSLEKTLHKTVKKVGEDIEHFKFNTAISAMMIFVNEMDRADSVGNEQFKKFLHLLAPFAPHVSEELWHRLGHEVSIHQSIWPSYDPEKILDEMVTLAIQVNGRVRGEIAIEHDAQEEVVREKALANQNVIKWTKDKDIKRFIYIPGKIINIVV